MRLVKSWHRTCERSQDTSSPLRHLLTPPPLSPKFASEHEPSLYFGQNHKRGLAVIFQRVPTRPRNRHDGNDLTSRLRQRPAWRKLEEHFEAIKDVHLRGLFADDPHRATKFSAEAEGIYLDYSKNRVTDETMALLMQLASESGLEERRDAMFTGDHINVSEDRAVLHVALRMPAELVSGRRRRRRGPGARGPRQDARLLRPRAIGRMEGGRPESPSRTSSTSVSVVRTSDR